MNALITKLHREEEGMEALQTVLIIALAAIVLAFAYKIFGGASGVTTDTGADGSNTVVSWVKQVIASLFKAK